MKEYFLLLCTTFQNLASNPADDIQEFLENVSIIVSRSVLRL